MEILIGIGVFALVLLGAYHAYRYYLKIFKPEQRQLHERLRIFSAGSEAASKIDILKKRTLSSIEWLNDALSRAAFTSRLERLHRKANVPQPVGFFVVLSGALVATGLFYGISHRMSFTAIVLPSTLLGAAPFYYLLYKGKKRIEKFERQLPEGLELMARAMKAGHAFTGGLRLVAEEMADPIGTEFKKTIDEINFGMDAAQALTNLTKRIKCEDLSFFAVAVIVQRETGGNLAEILENLGIMIRERFKFQGKVRTLAAQGKFSAVVLLAMPFVFSGLISLFNPDYITLLFTDPLGKYLIMAALTLMSVGALIIRKLIDVRA